MLRGRICTRRFEGSLRVRNLKKELRFLSKNAPTLYDKIDSWIMRIVKYVSYVSGVALVGIMLVAFFNVIGEKLRHAGVPFVTGIPASTEIITYLHIPVVFLAMAYVALDHGHTRIDLLSSHLPKVVQNICTTIGNLCGAVICGIISYCAVLQMNKHITRHVMSSVSGVGFPLWPFSLITVIGFALLSISFLWSIVRQYAGHEETHPEGGAQ